jgi:hypothetical protein
VTGPDTHLLAALSVAVPLEIDNLREQPDWMLDDLRTTLARDIQLNADTMQFGRGMPGQAAAGLVAQARVLALLALRAEGGVDFCGLHWCAVPCCGAATRFDHAPNPPE